MTFWQGLTWFAWAVLALMGCIVLYTAIAALHQLWHKRRLRKLDKAYYYFRDELDKLDDKRKKPLTWEGENG